MAASILSQVPAKFTQAKESGALLFFPSSIETHSELGVDWEIRLCPALQKKQQPAQDKKASEKPPDPFSPPYVKDLYIGELVDEDSKAEYAILLNKYSVVKDHILMVTKEFQSQTSPLLPPDLVQTFLMLAAARKARNPMFAFYNCGDNSGASQPHKHVQFIPVDEDGPPVERLALDANIEVKDKPFSLTSLPYANHVYRLPQRLASSPCETIEMTLSNAFMMLLDLTIQTIRHEPDYPVGKPSFNVIITLDHMHLIPRKLENYKLERTGEQLSVNSLAFAGMLLVKSDEEMTAVKEEGVGKILKGVGLESIHDEQVAGTSAEGPRELPQ